MSHTRFESSFEVFSELGTAKWDVILFSRSYVVASEESFLLSMGDPKNAIKSLILIVEQFCIKYFIIIFQF